MEDFDRLALEWDNLPRRRRRAKAVADGILKRVEFRPGMTGLEYGCGTGLLSFYLQPYFARMVLGDSSTGMLEVVRSKIEAGGFENMHAQRIDWSIDEPADERYDVIYTLMTLHHIMDYRALLIKFFRALMPGGYLCLADLEKEDGTYHGPDFIGHRGFDRRELTECLVACGFKVAHDEICFKIVKEGRRGKYPVFLITARKAEGEPS